MYMPTPGPDQSLIGLSLAVPQPWAGELQLARQNFGDPNAELIPPHITVIGPTVVDSDELRAIESHLWRVARSRLPFTVELDGAGTFLPTSPVVFIKVSAGAAECERLAADARLGLLYQPLRFPYHPHVTIAQEVPDDALHRALVEFADYKAQFEVESLLLSEPSPGGVWRIRRQFMFSGTGGKVTPNTGVPPTEVTVD
jgi:2'-5' RNA ligase